MKLDLFDDMNGFILRERENYLSENDRSAAPEAVSRFPAQTPLAMAYVPFQQIGEVYDDDAALRCGTLFPELNLPFSKGGTMK